jgi:CheY-like chemotaxis protein
MNLVGNAVKFTDAGEIVVAVKLVERRPTEAVLCFTITDTGIGISPETQQRLFQSFAQGDGSTTRKSGGTGLGLVISKQLAQLMGGEIGVESRPGQGSTFWFTAQFPVRLAPLSTEPMVPLSGLRVLCVAANTTTQSLLSSLLGDWDIQVDSEATGPDALARLRRTMSAPGPYDLVVLDHQLPGLDGIATAHAIQAEPALTSLPMVLLTALGHRGQSTAAQQVGITAYLTKPIRQSELYDCLATVLGRATGHALSSLVTRHRLTEVQAQARLKVLVVEDNVTNQMLAVKLLEQQGCRVDVASNGREAVEATADISYDCILMDCQMPEMDGFAATAAIRRREAATGQQIPIIAMTANAMQGDRERCLEAGMTDYLSKPVTPQQLAAMLQKWTDPPAEQVSVEP